VHLGGVPRSLAGRTRSDGSPCFQRTHASSLNSQAPPRASIRILTRSSTTSRRHFTVCSSQKNWKVTHLCDLNRRSAAHSPHSPIPARNVLSCPELSLASQRGEIHTITTTNYLKESLPPRLTRNDAPVATKRQPDAQ